VRGASTPDALAAMSQCLNQMTITLSHQMSKDVSPSPFQMRLLHAVRGVPLLLPTLIHAGIIPTSAKDLEAALELGMDYSL